MKTSCVALRRVAPSQNMSCTLSEAITLVQTYGQPIQKAAIAKRLKTPSTKDVMMNDVASIIRSHARTHGLIKNIVQRRVEGETIRLENKCLKCQANCRLFSFGGCGCLTLCEECANEYSILPVKKRRCIKCGVFGSPQCVFLA